MTNIDLPEIFALHADSSPLGEVMTQAVDLIEASQSLFEEPRSGSLQSSKHSAEIWAFRKRIGYLEAAVVIGLDETIAALDASDRPVSLRFMCTDGHLIVAWIDEHDTPAGVMIFALVDGQTSWGTKETGV